MPDGTSKRRLRPTPSIIISIFALVIAMSAGAYAVTIAPKNSVVSKSIKNKNVKSADIKPAAVKKQHLALNSVDSSKIVDGQVGSSEIADGSVGTNDLSATAKTDLNDATTLGGLTIAQIVAASGGEYYEGKQAAGDATLAVIESSRVGLASLQLPHAGKYLVNVRIPVRCSWDGTGGGGTDPEPDVADFLNQPYFPAMGFLSVGGSVVETQNESCEVEQGVGIFGKTWTGTATVEFTRQVTVAGPTLVEASGSGVSSSFGFPLFLELSNNNKSTATASETHIQAITVQ